MISSAEKNQISKSVAWGRIFHKAELFYRLKQLLDAEDRVYEQEFMANLETPEQVREKMAQRLEELKLRRE